MLNFCLKINGIFKKVYPDCIFLKMYTEEKAYDTNRSGCRLVLYS